jgi:hypothetical protein
MMAANFKQKHTQKFTALSIIAFTKVLGNLLKQIACVLLLESLKNLHQSN